MLENTEGAIKNWQSRESDNIVYTTRRKTNQKHNTLFVAHHYTQINTNNVTKTWALLKQQKGQMSLNVSRLPCKNTMKT